jgi:hypothetical protein
MTEPTEAREVGVSVHIGHPYTNMPDETTDERGRSTEIEIKDEESHQLVARIRMTPEQFGSLLAGRQIECRAHVSRHPERYGKRRITKLESIKKATNQPEPRDADELEALKARLTVQYRMAGWETVSWSRNNRLTTYWSRNDRPTTYATLRQWVEMADDGEHALCGCTIEQIKDEGHRRECARSRTKQLIELSDRLKNLPPEEREWYRNQIKEVDQ